MSTRPAIDPGTPEAEIAEFVAVIRTALDGCAVEQHGPAGGYQWHWANRGLWKITAAAVLDPDPLLEGPAGAWRIARANRVGAEYALQVLAGAGALPDGVVAPAPGGLYAGANRPPITRERTVDLRRAVPAAAAARPDKRRPGANTGARPGPSLSPNRPTGGGRFDGDGAMPAGMGPGAAYAPQRVDPGPLMPAPDYMPAGSDLPARGGGLVAGIDDTGRTAGAGPLQEYDGQTSGGLGQSAGYTGE